MVTGGGADSGQLQIGLRLMQPVGGTMEIWEPLADPPAPPRRIDAASRLDGAPQFPGLTLDLEEIWAG